MNYDEVLKEIIQTKGARIVQLIAGEPVVEWLNVELVDTEFRRADLIGRLASGRLFHLELQSSNDPEIGLRVLNYSVKIQMQYKEEPICCVLYVGEEPMTMSGDYRSETRTFRFRCLDIREIDPQVMLASNCPEDHILAVLCGGDQAMKLRRILMEIAKLQGRQRGDALAKLMVLCGLRSVEPLVLKEMENMPVHIDPMRIPFWKESFQMGVQEGLSEGQAKGRMEGRSEGRMEGRMEGRSEGEARLLIRQIERRFGALPDWAGNKLLSASSADLEHWGERILDARTLEDVFR